ncbi:inorganic diphosphatase [Candidatus Phytoplasma pini]|uniref:Inorganic pyrophosphatase n=1 Tax=Candidatus Phytoplasma pini TaxID=267362 RepID=A0A559KJT1_9MOLU|nr:inorganic diphosphatase [Candidatus Phytoplasma pini]TVY12386.1 Pyrophosphate phospho-hydrolase [Candidatus Phytoplasma pini]
MNVFQNIESDTINENQFLVMIEIPQGSKKKYEIDKKTGLLMLDRFLTTSFRYPANYGFIPLTYCDDKDPLDVFVLSQEILDPMILVKCRPIGVIKMIDNGELDEKIIAVIKNDVSMMSYKTVKDLPTSLISEIKHFLMHYKDLENKKVLIEKIEGSEAAFSAIKKALFKYKELQKK